MTGHLHTNTSAITFGAIADVYNAVSRADRERFECQLSHQHTNTSAITFGAIAVVYNAVSNAGRKRVGRAAWA